MNSVVNERKQQIETFRKVDFGVKENGKIDIPEHIRRGYDSAIRNLSKELYSKDIHFIFELIQNAQDNQYEAGVSKKIHFELLDYDPTNTSGCNGCLAIFNNEKGFELANIKAISTIGDSTKANLKDLGYIGEKGIGFKSVFAVSPSPHIYSNGYQIYFKDEDPDTGLGYIIPYWTDEVPQVVRDKQHEYNTSILLPLKQSADGKFLKKIEQELKQLDSAILMFLKQLNHISVLSEGYEATYLKSRIENTISIESTINGDVEEINFQIHEKTIDVPSSLNEEKRANVTSREITLAFPVKHVIQCTRLYSYLPTELQTGLPFLINADFLLPASRESVLVDNSWNIWMRDEVSIFVEDTLSSFLESSEDELNFGLIPLIEKCTVDFLKPIFEQSIERLKSSVILPNFVGTKIVSEHCVFADKTITELINAIEVNNTSIQHKLLPGYLHAYKKQISQLLSEEFSAVDFADYLVSGAAKLPSKPVDWFIAVYEWLAKQDKDWLYDGEEPLLLDVPLFLIDDDVFTRNETNLFLSSNINIQYPKLETADHAILYNLISQDIQKALFLHKTVNEFVKEYFIIEGLSPSEFLETVAFPYCVKHWEGVDDSQLWGLTHFVFQNWFSLSENTKKLITSNLPLKNGSDLFELNIDDVKQIVVPKSDEKSVIWQTIFSEEEQQNFIVLSDDYIRLFNSFEKLDKNEVFKELDITATPWPEKINVVKISRWGEPKVPEDKFGVEYSKLLFNKLNALDSTSAINAKITTVPDICYQEDKFHNIVVRKAFHAWLEGLERKSTSKWQASGWKIERINYFYQSNRSESIESELWQCVKNLKWLKTQNGCKRINEVFIPSQSSRELYGNAVNFLDNEFSFSDSLSKALRISSEVNSDTVLKVLRSWSEHNEECEIVDVTKIYERLADTRSDLKKLFANESLIYCPSGENNWCKTENTIWQSQKGVLGDLFHWLSDYYSIEKQGFWQNTVGVAPYPNPKSFADAWLELQKLPIQGKDEGRFVRNKLGVIYDRLIAYVRSVGLNHLDDWFTRFIPNAKCFTQSYRWANRIEVYISDDRRISDLLAPKGVEFFWRTRGKTHSDFNMLYEALELKAVAEEVSREVKFTRADLIKPTKPILTDHTRLLLAYYFYQFYYKTKTPSDTWYEEGIIFDLLTVAEYTIKSSIEVCYELNNRKAFAETRVYFDVENGWLVYQNNYQDEEDLIEDLAEEISKILVTKSFVEEEDHIRPLLGISSQKRLEKRINKKGWEKLLSKEEIELIKSLKRPVADEGFTENEDESDTSGVSVTSSGGSSSGGTSSGGTSSGGTSSGGSSSGGSSRGGTSSGGSSSGGTSSGGSSSGGKSSGGSSSGGTSSGGSSSGGKSSRGSSSDGTSSGGAPSASALGESRNSPGYRMVSYVESDKTHERLERDERNDQKFGYKAELFVRDWLNDKGYEVKLLGGNNKGYDITAIDPNTGELKFIEVKGIRGNWNRTGVALSYSQMEKCLQEGDNYWFIVVENMLSNPVINEFVNPAKLIDKYYFDGNWSKISEKSIVTIEPQKIDIDDLIFDDDCKSIYKNILEENIKIPEIGFELSNDRFEVIAELEFAWPDEKIGIYIEEPLTKPEGWNLYSIEEVQADFSILEKQNLVNKDDACYPA
jgi:hypothetical protein